MKKTLLIIAGSALVTAAAIRAAPALAEPASGAEVAVSVVRTADLDLSTPAGRRALDRRLAVAAHSVCDDPSAVDLKANNEEAECRDRVIASARQKAEAIAARGGAEEIRVAVAR